MGINLIYHRFSSCTTKGIGIHSIRINRIYFIPVTLILLITKILHAGYVVTGIQGKGAVSNGIIN